MVVTASEVFDLLECGDQNGCGLYPMTSVEAEDTVIALRKRISFKPLSEETIASRTDPKRAPSIH